MEKSKVILLRDSVAVIKDINLKLLNKDAEYKDKDILLLNADFYISGYEIEFLKKRYFHESFTIKKDDFDKVNEFISEMR